MNRISVLLLLLTHCLPAFAQPAYDAQRVKLLCNWTDSTASFNPNKPQFNDVWGFEWNGVEYAAIGSPKGVHIINVATCRQVAFAAAPNASASVIHRDYKTYGHYLYAVADETEAGMQVYDFSTLPDSIHLVHQGSVDTLMTAHNIFIDTLMGKLYAGLVKGRTLGNSNMQVYSLANGARPRLTHNLASFNSPLLNRVHDVFVRRDTAYMSCEQGGYFIGTFDATDQFKIIGDLTTYPNQGYSHSSWINEKNLGIMADESPVPLKVIRVGQLPGVNIVSEFSPCTGDTCVPHNPFLIDDIAYISHYNRGLQIYNIANPANPQRVGYFDTYPGSSNAPFVGAWGCYPYLKSRKVLISKGFRISCTHCVYLCIFNLPFALDPLPFRNRAIDDFALSSFTRERQASLRSPGSGQAWSWRDRIYWPPV